MCGQARQAHRCVPIVLPKVDGAGGDAGVQILGQGEQGPWEADGGPPRRQQRNNQPLRGSAKVGGGGGGNSDSNGCSNDGDATARLQRNDATTNQ